MPFNDPRANGQPRGENGREPISRGYPGYPTDGGQHDGVHVTELLGVLRRNWLLLLVLPLLTLGAGFYKWPKGPDRFSANAAMQVLNARRAMVIGLEDVGSDRLGRFTDPIVSHIEILMGRVVIGRAVDTEGARLRSLSEALPTTALRAPATDSAARSDTLRLRFDAAGFSAEAARGGSATAAYGERIEINGARFAIAAHPGVDTATVVIGSRDLAIDVLAAGVRATPRPSSDIVDVYFIDRNAARAQRYVNAIVEAHRVLSVEMAQDRSRRRREFLEEQLERADTRLAVAQGSLASFRSSNQLVNSAQRATVQQQSLMDLDRRVEELNAERRMARTMLDAARAVAPDRRGAALSALVSLPGLGSNQVVSSLYQQLAGYETEREGLTSGSTGVTEAHPRVQRLDELIASTRLRILEAAGSHLASLDERANALDGLRRQSSAEGRTLPHVEAEEARLAQEVLSYRTMADQLRAEVQKAEVAEALEAGQVEIVYFAPMPYSPLSRRRNRQLFFAFMFGGMLAVVGAFAREAMNTSVRRRRDLSDTLQLTELAVVPRIAPTVNGRHLLPRRRHNGNDLQQKVIGAFARNARQNAGAEAYRTLRTNLIFSHLTSELRSVIVTSAAPQEGKSTTAVNMAAAFAQQGMRVLLIDADLRRPSVHRALRMPLGPGLTSVLGGRDTLERAIIRTAIDGLSVLTAGPTVPNSTELLGGQTMRRMLQQLKTHYELIVVDTPPVLAATDAAVLAASTDGAVFVVRAGKTDSAAARQALEQLGMVDARVIGVVLNDPDMQVPKYGEYHYDYKYTQAG